MSVFTFDHLKISSEKQPWGKSSVQQDSVIMLSDTFDGTVLSSNWYRFNYSNSTVTVNNALELNQFASGAQSGAHIHSSRYFPFKNDILLEFDWLPSIKDHYAAGAGPQVNFIGYGATYSSYYNEVATVYIRIHLCQAGAQTTERTQIGLSAITNTSLGSQTTNISIDESSQHHVSFEINTTTAQLNLVLDYGAYSVSWLPSLTIIDFMRDGFKLDFGVTEYNKTNTERFKNIALIIKG